MRKAFMWDWSDCISQFLFLSLSRIPSAIFRRFFSVVFSFSFFGRHRRLMELSRRPHNVDCHALVVIACRISFVLLCVWIGVRARLCVFESVIIWRQNHFNESCETKSQCWFIGTSRALQFIFSFVCFVWSAKSDDIDIIGKPTMCKIPDEFSLVQSCAKRIWNIFDWKELDLCDWKRWKLLWINWDRCDIDADANACLNVINFRCCGNEHLHSKVKISRDADYGDDWDEIEGDRTILNWQLAKCTCTRLHLSIAI